MLANPSGHQGPGSMKARVREPCAGCNPVFQAREGKAHVWGHDARRLLLGVLGRTRRA